MQERGLVFVQFLLYLSNFMIPIVIFYIVGYGLCSHTDIFGAFVKGAQDGFKVVLKVLPTLIGLMMAIGILRASGLLEMLSDWIAPTAEKADFPAVLVPLSLIKMVSSSAATGLLLDIYKKRINRVLDIARYAKSKVVILGAFGCGAFANPPELVAYAMNAAINEHKYDFETIELAIYCPPRDTSNYEVFAKEFSA